MTTPGTPKPKTPAGEHVGSLVSLTIFGWFFFPIVNLIYAIWAVIAVNIANYYWPVIPEIGYWETWLLLNGIGVLAGAIKGGMKLQLKP